jgi:hypothetical protein
MQFFRILVCLGALAGVTAWAQNGPQGGMRGGMGGGMGMMGPGRNVMGSVSEAAADHAVVQSYLGASYTIHYSEKTRFFKQPPLGQPDEGRRVAGGAEHGRPPAQLKAADIKTSLDVEVQGRLDEATHTVEATAVVVMDPARAQAMRDRMQNWAKTWLAGKVAAIDGVQLTVQGSVDNLPHVIVADENTSLRKRREPITLADVAVGDQVMVQGSVKPEGFVATSINVMEMPQGGPVHQPREGQPPPQ